MVIKCEWLVLFSFSFLGKSYSYLGFRWLLRSRLCWFNRRAQETNRIYWYYRFAQRFYRSSYYPFSERQGSFKAYWWSIRLLVWIWSNALWISPLSLFSIRGRIFKEIPCRFHWRRNWLNKRMVLHLKCHFYCFKKFSSI